MPEWRTFSIRVNDRRKAVAVQARFPLTPEEWDELFIGLNSLEAFDLAGNLAGPGPVSVSARVVEQLKVQP